MRDAKEGLEIGCVRKDPVAKAMAVWTQYTPNPSVDPGEVIVVMETDSPNPLMAKTGDWVLLFTFIQEPGEPETAFEWVLLSTPDAEKFALEQLGNRVEVLEEAAKVNGVVIVLPMPQVH